MTLSLRRLAASLAIGGALLLVGFTLGHASGQRDLNMDDAFRHLRGARASLDKVAPDKAGHRRIAGAIVGDLLARGWPPRRSEPRPDQRRAGPNR